ncbi:MAG: hypothetical protein K6E10_05915 [Eubacterium sp.]|nr:hypothetical protein [Eubacterium sp.]
MQNTNANNENKNQINKNQINKNQSNMNGSNINQARPKYLGLKSCIKKDIKEVLRTGKLLIFGLLALGIGVMIMAFTIIFSNIPDFLAVELPGFDIESLEEMMTTLYPKIVSINIGVFSYYIGFFYGLVLVLVINGILPREIKKGRWILPLEQGYIKNDLILGKCIVYGIMAGACVFVSYILYYIIANTFMVQDLKFSHAFILGMVHLLNMFFIVAYTMLLSVWFDNGIIAAISVIGTLLFVPDIMNFLPIGKILPTYMLTFVYDSHTEFADLVMPLLINIITLLITYIFTIRKVDKL